MNRVLFFVLLAISMMGCAVGRHNGPQDLYRQRSLAITRAVERLANDKSFLKRYRQLRNSSNDKMPTVVVMGMRDKLLRDKLMRAIRTMELFDIIDFEKQGAAKDHLLKILEEGPPEDFDKLQHIGEYLFADYVLEGEFSVQKECQVEHYILQMQDIKEMKLCWDSIEEVGGKD